MPSGYEIASCLRCRDVQRRQRLFVHSGAGRPFLCIQRHDCTCALRKRYFQCDPGRGSLHYLPCWLRRNDGWRGQFCGRLCGMQSWDCERSQRPIGQQLVHSLFSRSVRGRGRTHPVPSLPARLVPHHLWRNVRFALLPLRQRKLQPRRRCFFVPSMPRRICRNGGRRDELRRRVRSVPARNLKPLPWPGRRRRLP